MLIQKINRSLTQLESVVRNAVFIVTCIAGFGAITNCTNASDFTGENEGQAKSYSQERNSGNQNPLATGVPDRNSGTTQNDDGKTVQTFSGEDTSTKVVDLDVVFVVDSSISMEDKKSRLEPSLTGFVAALSRSRQLNYQVIILGKQFVFQNANSGRIRLVDRDVEGVDLLGLTKSFIEDQSGSFLKLRPGSNKEIIIVSDGDSTNFSGSQFLSFLRSNEESLGTIHISTISFLPESRGSGTGGPDWCTKVSAGTQLIEVARDPEFGGETFDICTENWNGLLTTYADRILKNSWRTSFRLDLAPQSPDDITVTVNGTQVARTTGWVFDSITMSIVFNRGNVPAPGKTIVVTY